jgi:hypothetical protein
MLPAANDASRRLWSRMCSSTVRPERIRFAICFSSLRGPDLSELAHAIARALLRSSRGRAGSADLGNGDTALASYTALARSFEYTMPIERRWARDAPPRGGGVAASPVSRCCGGTR